MPAKRHIVTVMRPADALNEYGERQGKPAKVVQGPASIEFVGARQIVVANQQVNVATHRFKMRGDPANHFRYIDFIEVEGWPGRTFQIGQINGDQATGQELELLCGEKVS